MILEGIETPAMLEQAGQLGADLVQGFSISYPTGIPVPPTLYEEDHGELAKRVYAAITGE